MTNNQGASRRRSAGTPQRRLKSSRPGHSTASPLGRRYNQGDASVKRDKVFAALLLAGILAAVATAVVFRSPILGAVIYALGGGALILASGLLLVPAFRFSDADS